MIEQLWYTWSLKGLGTIPGLRVRAASAQLANSPRLSTLQAYLNYVLPLGANPATINPLDAPLCLAFLKDKDGQGALVNKRYIGRDEQGRPGNYFAHLLTDLPQGFSVRQAISTWKADFWRYDDASHPNEIILPPMSEADLKPNSAERPDLTNVLPTLPFVIHAFLSLQEKQRIYIADVPERVAALVFALTESLPAFLLERLTFSTYERDFAQSPALLVGTYWTGIEQGTSQDLLPAACYASDKGPALAINGYSQRQSPLPANPSIQAFAKYATEHFSRPNELLTIRAIAEDHRQLFRDIPTFLYLADFYTGMVNLAQLAGNHLDLLLGIPKLANSFLKREETQQALLAQIELPTQWWTTSGRTRMKYLAEQHNTGDVRVGLIGLATKAVGRMVAALQANRQPEAEHWAALIWDVAPPPVTPEPWLALLNTLAGGGVRLSKNLRHTLLWAWHVIASRQPGAANIALLRPWLEVSSWDEFKELLRLKLPSDWCKISLEKLLGSPVGGAIVDPDDHLEAILKDYMSVPQDQPLGIWLFARLAEWGYVVKLPTITAILKQIHQQPQAAGLFLRVGIARRTLPVVVDLLTGIPAASLPQVLVELVLADPDWGGADAARLREWRAQIGQGSANGSAWLLSAPDWWKRAGQASVSQLGDQMRRSQAGALIPAFTALGNQIRQRLVQAVQQPHEPMLIFLVEALATVSASGVISDPWLDIWNQVSTLPKPLSWSARFALLAKWQTHAAQLDENAPRSWLRLSWADVDQRLWTLPVHWQRLALTPLLSSSLNQPQDVAQATAALDRCGDQIEPLLASLFRTGQTQPLVISFFNQVAAHGRFTRKISLLSALLDAASGNQKLWENLLRDARIAPEETTTLIEQYSAPLLRAPTLPDLYLQQVKDYFDGLTTGNAAQLAATDYQPIRQLGTYAYTKPGNAALAALFTSLTDRAQRTAARMLRQGVHESATFWVSILALTIEASKQTGEWLKLLRAVKQPGPGIMPDLLLYLACRWADFKKELTLDEIRPWLQFDWRTAQALMQQIPSASFPEAWRLEVFLGLIARQQAALSHEEAGIVSANANFQWVGTAMQAAVQDASKQEQALAFLGKLAQAKIHQRVHLLPDLLLSAADNPALAERMWQAANPTRRQGEWFRTYQLPRLQDAQGTAPGWRLWLEQTLNALAPAGGRAMLQPSGGQGAVTSSGGFFSSLGRIVGQASTAPPPGASAPGESATGQQRARKGAANQPSSYPFPSTPRQPAALPPGQPHTQGPLVEQGPGGQAKGKRTAQQGAPGHSKARTSSAKRRQEQADTFGLWIDRILIALVTLGAIALILVILLLFHVISL